MAAKPGLSTGNAYAPRTDGTHLTITLTAHSNLICEDNIKRHTMMFCYCCFLSLQVMCVLMVCFNVLELLLDETALPRGMEVGTRLKRSVLSMTCNS